MNLSLGPLPAKTYFHWASILLLMIGFFMASCSLTSRQFNVQPDGTDFIDYAFGGGELGAEWTQIVIRGNGQITYQYTFPYDDTWPQEEIHREYQLSAQETKRLFQSLVNAGLFDLSYMDSEGVDIPRTLITAHFDEYRVEAAMDGTPDESIHAQMEKIISKVHPER